LVADGIDVIELSEQETAEWKKKAQSVYEKFEPTFSPGLIDKIKKA
jgi:TRAP-type C4-dicarboxylate transport system substrate-binding protein